VLARLLLYLLTRPWNALRAWRARACFDRGRKREALKDWEGARKAYEQAVSLSPNALDWWIALGDVRFAQGDFAKAALCYGTAARPDAPADAHLRLGRALFAAGDAFEAIGALRVAHTKDPRSEEALRELVHALVQTDNVRKAKEIAAGAVARDPASFAARLVLAMVCQKSHEPEEAIQHYEEALRLRPGDAEAHDMRGATYQQLGRLEDALADYERALAAAPDNATARFHLGMANLLLGNFERGWPGYELRKLSEDSARPPARAPIWDGAPLRGTLLVRREQGLGDEIMFASLYGEVLAKVEACVIECEPRLRSLFARSFPAATFYPALPGGATSHRLAAHPIDREIDAGSLPGLFRRNASMFPRHAGYLKADSARTEKWRRRLEDLGPGRKIGLSWTGGVRKTGRGLRSLTLDRFLPLLSLPDTQFISLQYTPEAEKQVEQFSKAHRISLHHWPEAIDDYEETAALVSAVDLVVSVCTSVVHLCGALNRPAWVLAPFSPEWRYGFRGASMPWYPSVRIFRQERFGDWDQVLANVQAELARQPASVA
jgi:tetratricopeptide (TPR) repeat protein